MGIFDWFKKKKDEQKSLKELKQCDCGEVWCNSCQDQHKRCECGKFFHKNFDLCPYCHRTERKNYNMKNIEEHYSNGKLKILGTLHYSDCTGWGGPFDCRIIGGGCPECLIPGDGRKWKEDYWKYYYENGNLCNEGRYLNDKREGEWKFYSENGNLTGKITFKNGEVVKEST